MDQKDSSAKVTTKAGRKAKERRKKALATLEDLLARNSSLEEKDASKSFYEPLAELIQQRSVMRDHWAKREKDYVFRELDEDCRPMTIPFQFNVKEGTKQTGEVGISPMNGSPLELKAIAEDLLAYGKAYQSGKRSDLPETNFLEKKSEEIEEKDHAKTLKWPGWGQNQFGLELQQPWAADVVEGRKPIETRSYDLPPSLIGKRIMIIESPAGKPGVSGMGDWIDLSESSKKCGAHVIGWCVFEKVKKYTTRDGFEADEKEHLVTRDSGYGWKDGKTDVVYGWVVGQCSGFSKNEVHGFASGIRRMRSLFQLSLKDSNGGLPKKKNKNHTSGSKQKKKRRRY